MHIHVHTLAHICVNMYTHVTHVCVHINSDMYVCTCIYVHVYMYIYIECETGGDRKQQKQNDLTVLGYY